MRFSFGCGCSFEITGIKKVVVNEIRMNGKEKEKVGKTFVWELAHVKKGLRWLKYEWGTLQGNKTVEELRAAILDGASQVEIHDSIKNAMCQTWVSVWFSGETCNIEINLTDFDKIKAAHEREYNALLEGAKRLAIRAERKLRLAERISREYQGRAD